MTFLLVFVVCGLSCFVLRLLFAIRGSVVVVAFWTLFVVCCLLFVDCCLLVR